MILDGFYGEARGGANGGRDVLRSTCYVLRAACCVLPRYYVRGSTCCVQLDAFCVQLATCYVLRSRFYVRERRGREHDGRKSKGTPRPPPLTPALSHQGRGGWVPVGMKMGVPTGVEAAQDPSRARDQPSAMHGLGLYGWLGAWCLLRFWLAHAASQTQIMDQRSVNTGSARCSVLSCFSRP